MEVLIPHWNRASSLRRTLESLQAQRRPAQVCVIDNGSTDETPKILAEFPGTRIIRLNENLGFGPAINRGAATSTAELIVLLNNDAVADPEFVDALVAEQGRTGAEMVCACMRHPDGTVESLGIEIDQSLIAYDYMHGASFEEIPSDLQPPFSPSGGAVAFLRAAFLDVGGFDEAIFAYLEDAELGLRMRGAGMRCAIAPRAFVWHQHSASLGARSTAKNELLGWSRAYILAKHGSMLSWRRRVRGAAIDAIVIAGKAVIDHDLGVLKGGRRARRELRETAFRAGPGLPVEPLLAELPFATALRWRLGRRRRGTGGPVSVTRSS
ncbi:MAG: glycosyltransferase family 2 protein [Actinomycetota bacterium]|nr:glycosyltransferase family 2 protein [Actinomycetota bacterium]